MTDLAIAKFSSDLKTEDRKKRKKTLEKLSQFLHEHYSHLAVVERVEQIFKPILRCLSDSAEACREQAAIVITDIISSFGEDEQYVMYLMPVLLQRLGGKEIMESSEEVRLLLVILLHTIVAKYSSKLLLPYVNDYVQILSKTLVDPYPKVKKESCECAADLAEKTPRHFYMQSENLIIPLLQNLTHQHYRLRIAGINGIGKVVRYGNNKSVDTVITPLAERLFDQTPMVRQAVVSAIGMWLVELPDRYSFFHRLLPLILTSLTDESEEVKKVAAEHWDAAGKLYMLENEADLKDDMDFLSACPEHYPLLETRPNLGCRALVKRHLSKIVPAVVNELEDWLADIRTKASQLLYSLILNSEIQITHHLEKILVGMYRASKDDDPRVVYNIERASELIGYFVPPDTYCKLILPTMEESVHEGQLKVFACVLKGSERKTLSEKLLEIGDFLRRPYICQSKEKIYQLQLLNCCEALMTVAEEDCRVISFQLFIVMLSVLGLAADEYVNKRSLECLHDLQLMEQCPSLQVLFKKHVQPVLEQYKSTADTWSLYSSERFIFEAILTYSGPTIGLHLDIITPILVVCLKPEKDPEVKLKMFTILSTLILGKEHILKNASNLSSFLVTLVQDVITPNLVWQAGRTAEAIRTAGIACLFVAFKETSDMKTPFTDPEILKTVLEPLLPLLLALLEDSSKRTRQIACRTVSRMITLIRSAGLYSADIVNKVYPVVLKRLDDVDDEVRLIAVATLVEIFRTLPGDYDRELSKAHIDALFSTMLIHLDDPDKAFQHIVLDALKKVAQLNPKLLYEKLDKSMSRFRNLDICNQLKDYTLELMRHGTPIRAEAEKNVL